MWCIIAFILFTNSNIKAQSLYFSTPQESVKLTSKLLLEEDWNKLTNYYSLQNSDSDTIASLKNGSYFIRSKKPEASHPAVDWKYKKPFPPNFNYLSHSEIGKDSVKVDVILEIDQGNDMIQRGISTYYLKKSKKGYQLLY